MFGFFALQEKKMRENAGNWLELAEKVYYFRRDVLAAAEVEELKSHIGGLKALLKGRAGAENLKLAIEQLEDVLRRTGGAIYPKSSLVENVEFFLVAAIVILGIRTYFVQPFKIPTNSMWPTYNGMTPEAFGKPSEEPNLLMRAVRFVAFGATSTRVDAPAAGEISVPLGGAADRIAIPYRSVPGRTWLVLPTTVKEYTLYVGEQPVKLQVPADFDFEWAVRDALFPGQGGANELGGVALANITRERGVARLAEDSSQLVLRTGKTVQRGERVVSFDILTGDQLFVDRMSYHFVRPSVGQGFVFRTLNISGIGQDQYYIKRLIGVPGDKLEIREPAILRNDKPIEGADAFTKNAARTERHAGYFNANAKNTARYLAAGETLAVPKDSYFAMGDNSGNSMDGRYWGFVPAKDVVGKPLFVYFPFTRHWGPAK